MYKIILLLFLTITVYGNNFEQELAAEISIKNKTIKDNGSFVFIEKILLNKERKILTFKYKMIKNRIPSNKLLKNISLKNDKKIDNYTDKQLLETFYSFGKKYMCTNTNKFISLLRKNNYKVYLNINLFLNEKKIKSLNKEFSCKK